MSERGAPAVIRYDNGPALVASRVPNGVTEAAHGLRARRFEHTLSEHQRGYNDCPREECVNALCFPIRRAARILIDAWRERCNATPLHSSAGYLAPTASSGQNYPLRRPQGVCPLPTNSRGPASNSSLWNPNSSSGVNSRNVRNGAVQRESARLAPSTAISAVIATVYDRPMQGLPCVSTRRLTPIDETQDRLR